LWLVFGVAIAHGISTEAFDRLFQLHIIKDIGLPAIGGLDRVVWFGIIEGGGLLLAIAAAEYIKRRVDVTDRRAAVRALTVIDVFLIAGVVAFGLSGGFAVALTTFWACALLREVRSPLFDAWVNQGLDPATRATVNSMASQMDAVGQMAGGPAIGLLAVARSVQAAIVAAGLLRLPTLGFFRRALNLPSGDDKLELDVEGAGLDVAGIPGPPHAPTD
jgi:DHA3 family tetracycline resistance protein-like MFS transporter